jgi:uncharacterized protein (DUF1330 family)
MRSNMGGTVLRSGKGRLSSLACSSLPGENVATGTEDQGVAIVSQPQPGTRPGYLVVQGVVTDREGFKAYSAALPPIYAKYGGQYLAMVPAPLVEVAEGDPENRSVVVARFPSKEAARAFWNSPEYAEAKKLRAGKGTFYVMVLEGLPE